MINLISFSLWLVVCVLLCSSEFSRVSAEKSNVDTEEDASTGYKDLGSRSKINLINVEKSAIEDDDELKHVDVDLDLDSIGLGVLDAFFASLSMILGSEIGDETFIIAALMAMRHPKSIALSGALTALIVMTVLSTGLGRIVPNLISRKHTNTAATGRLLISVFSLIICSGWMSTSMGRFDKSTLTLLNSCIDDYIYVFQIYAVWFLYCILASITLISKSISALVPCSLFLPRYSTLILQKYVERRRLIGDGTYVPLRQ